MYTPHRYSIVIFFVDPDSTKIVVLLFFLKKNTVTSPFFFYCYYYTTYDVGVQSQNPEQIRILDFCRFLVVKYASESLRYHLYFVRAVGI